MTQRLHHRGPDDQGVESFGAATLGHARLSIIDRSSAGRQPMVNEDGTVAVVFNGEIYNFKVLRAELIRSGHRFHSNTDSEILVHGYEEWGIEELLARCDGMWAFALWDTRRETLHLARDRFGEKPLFHMSRGGVVRFASTLDALLFGQPGPPAYREDVVAEYLACGFVPPDRCVFDGVAKLGPGERAEIRHGKCVSYQYWNLSYSIRRRSSADALAELDHQLQEAVRSRLVADVPVGAFLSGGIDSSLVVANMANERARPLTFTMRVPASDRDEGPYAAAVAKSFDTEHIEVMLEPDCAAALPTLIRHVGEPYADSSIIPAQFVAGEIRRYATVVLGGDGGDEGFGGYRGVPYARRLEHLNHHGLSLLAPCEPTLRRLSSLCHGTFSKALRILAYSSSFAAYARDWTAFDSSTLSALAGSRLLPWVEEACRQPALRALENVEADHWYQRLLAVQYRLVLAGDFMVKVDTAAMLHGVEARSPFLAPSLVMFAATLPPEQIANAEGDKVLTRALARKLLPRHCVDRNKGGFSIPVDRWLDGVWGPLVEKLLVDGMAVQENLINSAALRSLLDGDRRFQYRRARLIYTLFCLEMWLRLCVDGQLGAADMEMHIRGGVELQACS